MEQGNTISLYPMDNTQTVPPMHGTDMVNQASNMAIQQALHDNNVNNVVQSVAKEAKQAGDYTQNLLGMSPFTGENVAQTVMQKKYMNLLLGTKQQYENAMANGDQQGMTNASQQAEVYREAAKKSGIDVSGVGSDKSLAQSQAAMNVFNAQNYGTLFGGTNDSGTVYNELYEKARGAGMSDEGADQYAYGKAKAYQQRRLQALNDELYTQGINPNNSINAYGIQLISAMRDEDPEAADVVLQTFGVPLNEYKFSKENEAQDSALARKTQLLGVQGDINKALTAQKIAGQKDLANIQANTQLSLADKKAALERMALEARANSPTGNANNSGIKLDSEQRKLENKVNQKIYNLQNYLSKEATQATAPEEEANAMQELQDTIKEAENSGKYDIDTINDWWSLASSLYDSYEKKYRRWRSENKG